MAATKWVTFDKVSQIRKEREEDKTAVLVLARMLDRGEIKVTSSVGELIEKLTNINN